MEGRLERAVALEDNSLVLNVGLCMWVRGARPRVNRGAMGAVGLSAGGRPHVLRGSGAVE